MVVLQYVLAAHLDHKSRVKCNCNIKAEDDVDHQVEGSQVCELAPCIEKSNFQRDFE